MTAFGPGHGIGVTPVLKQLRSPTFDAARLLDQAGEVVKEHVRKSHRRVIIGIYTLEANGLDDRLPIGWQVAIYLTAVHEPVPVPPERKGVDQARGEDVGVNNGPRVALTEPCPIQSGQVPVVKNIPRPVA